jgi:hypothetical protein
VNRHLFILPPGVYRGANIEEVRATINGLVEMDLFRLPYDRDVFVQLPASDCITYRGDYDELPTASFVVAGTVRHRSGSGYDDSQSSFRFFDEPHQRPGYVAGGPNWR